MTDLTWQAHAECRGRPADLWFPADIRGVQIAQRICAGCPVQVACLEHALTERIDHGVWGGASERERRRMRSERRRAAA